MKAFPYTILSAPVLSGVTMFVWEAKSVTRLHIRNHRNVASGRDEIAMG